MASSPRLQWIANRAAVALGVDKAVIEDAFADERHADMLETLFAAGGHKILLVLNQPRYDRNEVRPPPHAAAVQPTVSPPPFTRPVLPARRTVTGPSAQGAPTCTSRM